MFQDTSETDSTGGAVGGSEGPPNNGPSLPPGLSPAVAAAAAAAGGVGAHSLLQQTMCQLLRPSSPRGDAPSSPPPLGHPSEPPRSLHWGAQDLRPDLDRQDAHSPPSIDPTKVDEHAFCCLFQGANLLTKSCESPLCSQGLVNMFLRVLIPRTSVTTSRAHFFPPTLLRKMYPTHVHS